MGGNGTILHIIHKKTVYCDRSNLDGLLSVWAACCPAKNGHFFISEATMPPVTMIFVIAVNILCQL